jgi:hypothetical protein
VDCDRAYDGEGDHDGHGEWRQLGFQAAFDAKLCDDDREFAPSDQQRTGPPPAPYRGTEAAAGHPPSDQFHCGGHYHEN